MQSTWGRLVLDEIENFKVEEGFIIWYLGGPSIAIKSPESIIYVDIYTDYNQGEEWLAMRPNIIDPSDINVVDAILLTHCHSDHTYPPTLKEIIANNNKVKIFGPDSSINLIKNTKLSTKCLNTVYAGSRWKIGDMEIEALAGNDKYEVDALMYLIKIRNLCLLINGDDLYFEGFKKYGKENDIDIAVLSFGRSFTDQKQYMDYKDIVQCAIDLGVKILIPKHWDMWKCIYQDPEIINFKYGSKLPFQLKILRLGDCFEAKEFKHL